MSQTPRNEWPNDKVERRTDTYGNWSKIAADKEGAHYIDLNEIVALKYEVLGKEKVSIKVKTYEDLKGFLNLS